MWRENSTVTGTALAKYKKNEPPVRISRGSYYADCQLRLMML